jgi:ABC-2 type transport system permease protein
MVDQLIIFPLMFLSGIFFPVNNVPVWLQVIAKVNPVSYGVDAVRQVVLDGSSAAGSSLGAEQSLGINVLGHTMTVLEDAIVLVLLSLLLMTAAVWSFNRQE